LNIPLQTTVDAAAVLETFRKLPKQLQTGVKSGLGRGLLVAESRVRTGTGLKFRRGGAGLSGRLTSFVRTTTSGDIEGAIGFRKTRGFPYELAQEFGAKAKPGRAMSIPVSPEAKAASNRGEGPRSFGNRLRLVKGLRKMLLVEDRFRGGGRGGGASIASRTDLHYVLVKSIPARLRFRDNVQASIPYISEQVVKGARASTGAS
jgi:hypothetical protein